MFNLSPSLQPASFVGCGAWDRWGIRAPQRITCWNQVRRAAWAVLSRSKPSAVSGDKREKYWILQRDHNHWPNRTVFLKHIPAEKMHKTDLHWLEHDMHPRHKNSGVIWCACILRLAKCTPQRSLHWITWSKCIRRESNGYKAMTSLASSQSRQCSAPWPKQLGSRTQL